MAAILHDVGYGQCIHLPHAQVSAKIARDYLEMNNFELDFINEVVYLVENHSKKELLKNNEVNDLILLQEADLLDDTGALGIILDIMVEHTKNEECDFMDCYNHIIEYSQRIMKNNPMVSKTAKRFWKQKQMMVNNFIESLEQDLGIEL